MYPWCNNPPFVQYFAVLALSVQGQDYNYLFGFTGFLDLSDLLRNCKITDRFVAFVGRFVGFHKTSIYNVCRVVKGEYGQCQGITVRCA